MIATSQFTISVINDGAPGQQGVSVSNVIPEYRLSDSSTELTGDTTLPAYQWDTTKPEVPSGKYIWTRNRNELSNGTTVYSDAVCDVVTSGLVFDVDRNTNAITKKVWQTDITTSINSYDSTTTQGIRDRVTQTETDISGINTTISDVQSTLSTKADGSTVTNLTSRVQTVEDTAATHTRQISETNTALGNTITTANQTADQLSWVIDTANKTSSTFTFKSRVMELVNADLVIKDPAGNSTVISGGKLSTDAIKSTNYVAGTSGSPYSSVGTFLDLATGNIYMPSFGVNATTGAAYFSGQINAETGSIGGTNGFTIASGKMYTNGKSGVLSANSGVYIGTDGIYLGAGSVAQGDCPFTVSNNGYLTCKYGEIGGWEVGSGYMRYITQEQITISDTSPVLDVKTSYYLQSSAASGTPGIWFMEERSNSGYVVSDKRVALTIHALQFSSEDPNDSSTYVGSRIDNNHIIMYGGDKTLLQIWTVQDQSTNRSWNVLEMSNSSTTQTIKMDSNTGDIKSNSAKISNWYIKDDSIYYDGTYTDQNSNSTQTRILIGNGVNANRDVLVVRHGTSALNYTYPFYIHSDGSLHALTTDINSSGISTSGSISCNALTATGAISCGSITSTGAISGDSLTTTGAISGASITTTGAISGASLTTTGAITCNSLRADVSVNVKHPTNGACIILNVNDYGSHGLASQGYYPGDARTMTESDYIKDFKWLFYRDSTGHVTIPRNLTVTGQIKTTQDGNYSFQAVTSTNAKVAYNVKNSLREGDFEVSNAGNLGIYDTTNSKWLLYSEKNGYISHMQTQLYCRNTAGDERPVVTTVNDSGAHVAALRSASTNQLHVYGEFGTANTYKYMYVTMSTSDPRLKENIKNTVINALSIINQIPMHQFDWKTDGKHWDVGLIAPELYEIDPNLAIKPLPGEEDIAYWGVDSFYLTGMLTKAVQELSSEVTNLKEEIAALKRM